MKPFWMLLLPLAILASPAHADDDHDRAREALQRGAVLPLSRILDIVKRDTPGRVIDVDLDEDDGRYVYEIEMIGAHGRVVEIKVNAANGQIIEREIDD